VLITELLAGAGISCNGSSPLISDNVISDNVSFGYVPGLGGGIGCFYGADPLISGNVIINNLADFGFGGGIYCHSSSPVISGNLIVGNDTNEGGYGGGIFCEYGADPLIINNTICSNAGDFGAGLYAAAVPTVINTIIRDNIGGENISFYDVPPIITYSDIEGGWEGEGNIDCDPMFCAPEFDNFFLHTSSCCLGSGQGGADIGAFGAGCGDYCGYYLIGDFNGSGGFNVADIVDSYSKLKTGLPEPALLCECPPNSGNEWAVAADVNNSCAFNVADIVDGYSFLKTGLPEPSPCGICPPGEP
jgi:hypothetical protein